MDPQNVVCLYSKFSSHSQRFMELAKKLPMNFVCIDNERVRNRVIKDTRLNIQFVPCILCTYSNGTLEKYEGDDAFNWVNNLLKIMKRSQEQIETQKLQQTSVAKNMQNTKEEIEIEPEISTTSGTMIGELEFEEDEEIVNGNEDPGTLASKMMQARTAHLETQRVSSGMKAPENEKIEQATNKKSTKGKVDIMAAAKEMEKARESSETANKQNFKKI